MRIEGGQLAPVGLFDADGHLAAEFFDFGPFVAFLQQPQRLADHVFLRSVSAALHQRADELLPIA
jgi:hypothetical protein